MNNDIFCFIRVQFNKYKSQFSIVNQKGSLES